MLFLCRRSSHDANLHEAINGNVANPYCVPSTFDEHGPPVQDRVAHWSHGRTSMHVPKLPLVDVALQIVGAEGSLLVLPISGPGVHFQRPFLDQRVHGRVLVADPQRPGLPAGMDSAWTKTETAAWLSSLAFCAEENPEPHHRCEPPANFQSPPDVSLLYSPPAYRDELEALLGPPARAGTDGATWEISP